MSFRVQLLSLQPIDCKPLLIIDLLRISPLQFPHFIPLFEKESIGPSKTFMDRLAEAINAGTRGRRVGIRPISIKPFRSAPRGLTDSGSCHPACGQHLCLFDYRPGCLLLFVRRVAVLAQYALDQPRPASQSRLACSTSDSVIREGLISSCERRDRSAVTPPGPLSFFTGNPRLNEDRWVPRRLHERGSTTDVQAGLPDRSIQPYSIARPVQSASRVML